MCIYLYKHLIYLFVTYIMIFFHIIGFKISYGEFISLDTFMLSCQMFLYRLLNKLYVTNVSTWILLQFCTFCLTLESICCFPGAFYLMANAPNEYFISFESRLQSQYKILFRIFVTRFIIFFKNV